MCQVALVMPASAMLYETAIASEIFGVDRSERSLGGRWYDLVVAPPDGTPHAWLPHLRTVSDAGIAHPGTAVVPSTHDLDAPPDPELLTALRAAHGCGARVA